jgi:O-antigen/teichoic acid export membrane protein
MSKSVDRRLHERLTVNSASNLLRYIASMAVAFFLTPFIVRTLGDASFGFWVLLMSFIGYAGILEMGVQPAVVKLVGQYKGGGDVEKLQELITAGLAYFLAVGGLVALVSATLGPVIVQRYVKDLHDLPHSRLLFAAIALDALFMYLDYLVSGILYGWQRYHLRNLIEIAGWILNTILVVTFLRAGGLLALVACKLITDVGIVVASAIAARRLFPGLRLRFGELRRGSFKELVGFGGRVFVSATATRIATNAQPVIISTAISSSATTFFSIPGRLVEYARQIAWALTTSFMPMFSDLKSRNERSALSRIYLDYSRYIFLILLPVVVLLFIYGTAFIHLWIGPEYAIKGRMVLLLTTGALLVESFQPLLWRFFMGVGQLNVLVTVSAATAGLAVVLSVLLVKPLGIAGVALAGMLGTVVAQSLWVREACRYLEVSPASLFKRVHLRPLLAAVVMLGVAELLAAKLGARNYAAICVGAGLSLVPYAAIGVRLGLTREERDALRGKLAMLTRKRTAPATDQRM